MLRAEKARNCLIISNLPPPPPQLIYNQVVTCNFSAKRLIHRLLETTGWLCCAHFSMNKEIQNTEQKNNEQHDKQ
jgi:hypothetical protein